MASIGKREDGRWRARYRDPDGREHARHFSRKADAERWLDQIRGDLTRGTYVDPTAGRVLFSHYAKQWAASQPHRPSTAQLYERTLRLHVLPAIGDRQLSSLRRSDVQALVGALNGKLSPKTTENVFKLVRAILSSAVDDGLIASNPCRRVARKEVEGRLLVPLSMAQVIAVADRIAGRYRALVLLAGGTGLRQGEALGLRAEDVDFLRRELHVRHQLVSVPGTPYHLGPTKTASSRRTVPVPDFVLEALSAHMRTHPAGPWGLLFTNSLGQVVARSSFHRSWRAAVLAAELPPSTTFHDLRHAYASALIEGGESVTVVAARLGHKNSTETLRTYSHLWPSSDDKTRLVLQSAFALADSVRTSEVPQASDLRF